MSPIRVPIVRPDLGAAEADAAARVVRSGWVMQGPEVAAFEKEFAAFVGAPHAVAVSSGTAALALALHALGVGPGDEVATVSHSFVATANVIVTAGAHPVFVDVERGTFGMDPARLEAALSPRTKAILCVHQLGIPCDLPAILAIALRRELPVIEDAACAIGSELEVAGVAQRIGRPHGRIACFSFHPRKVLTTGEGGMITCPDALMANRLRLLRQHAMSVPPEARDRDPLAREAYLEPAFNARLTDLGAAIGRPQLARMDAILAERHRLASSYQTALVDHPALAAPGPWPGRRTNWQSYPVQVRAGSRQDRETLLRWFFDRGIACRRGVSNAHQEPAYADVGNWSGGPLPVSEALRESTLMLPLFHGMTADEHGLVLAALADLRQ